MASAAADVAAAATAAAAAAAVDDDVAKRPALDVASKVVPVVEYMDRGEEWYGTEFNPTVKKLFMAGVGMLAVLLDLSLGGWEPSEMSKSAFEVEGNCDPNPVS